MAFIGFIDPTGRFIHKVDQVHKGRLRPAHGSIPWVPVYSVPGFSHLLEVVTREQQGELIHLIDAEPSRWEDHDRLMRQYYGYRYHDQSDSLSQVDYGVLPPWLLQWSRFIRARGW